MEKRITPEEVRLAVGKFWTLFSGKSKDRFEEAYLPGASVLSFTAARAEPGRLALARRARKLFGSSIALNAELGTIDVQIVGDNTAVATYVYVFQTTMTESDGSRIRHTTPARATHVFQRDEHGVLRIIHEHLSAGTAPTVETIAKS